MCCYQNQPFICPKMLKLAFLLYKLAFTNLKICSLCIKDWMDTEEASDEEEKARKKITTKAKIEERIQRGKQKRKGKFDLIKD